MTLALDTPPRLLRPRAALRLGVSGSDALALGALALFWASLFLLHWDALPMQLWDESRNVNNALEMARSGHWLAPTYAGVVDHWNTKPPLLIWLQAGLLRLGLPVLLAARLPSWLAAAATAGLVWGVLRGALKDRLAAFAGGVLLLSALAYVGEHAARTGDYDALESLFILGYALSLWRALEEDGRTRWLHLAAALMALGVLTKGVAALLPLPGLAAYALTRPGRLLALLKDVRAWGAALLFVALAGGYYAAREAVDPGYVRAVAANELGGRFLHVTENHRGSWHFYLTILLVYAEPCLLFAALGLVTLSGADGRRRRLVLAMGLAGGSLLLVLSASRSKMSWYITPLVPILAVIAGAGLSDALRWMQEPRRRRWAPSARAAAALMLGAAALLAVGWNQAEPDRGGPASAQLHYGPFLEAVRAEGLGPRIAVVDEGFRNDAGFADYDPMLKAYAEAEASRGLQVTVLHDAATAGPLAIGTCDPRALRRLAATAGLQPVLAHDGCRLFHRPAP